MERLKAEIEPLRDQVIEYPVYAKLKSITN